MGNGGVPTSRGGPLRRRKEKRQLEHLAAATVSDGSPRASAAHVKLLGDEAAAPAPPPEKDDSAPPDAPPRTGGFHVRAVPIDQPVGD